MANSTDATPEQLRDLIIETYTTLKEYQSNMRVAKKTYEDALRKLPAYDAYTIAQNDADNAKDKLKAVLQNDPDMTELAEDAKYARDAVASAKATLSRLLVKQATQSKNASVDIGEANNHEIILTARLGREAPEQLDLFDELTDEAE